MADIMNSNEAVDIITKLHQAAEEEWDDPDEFQYMLTLAASDAGMSDAQLGVVGARVDD